MKDDSDNEVWIPPEIGEQVPLTPQSVSSPSSMSNMGQKILVNNEHRLANRSGCERSMLGIGRSISLFV